MEEGPLTFMSTCASARSSSTGTCLSGMWVLGSSSCHYNATATHITCTNTFGASTLSHTRVPRGGGLGSHVVRRTTGRTSRGTPERLRPSYHLARNATAHCAVRTIIHLPRRLRAKTQQVAGMRGLPRTSGMWVCAAHRLVRYSHRVSPVLLDASAPCEDGKKDVRVSPSLTGMSQTARVSTSTTT